MKKKNRSPLFWKYEEYAFGAMALKEEIERHKKEDNEHWSIFKFIGMRLLLIYVIIAAFCTLIICSINFSIQKILKK